MYCINPAIIHFYYPLPVTFLYILIAITYCSIGCTHFPGPHYMHLSKFMKAIKYLAITAILLVVPFYMPLMLLELLFGKSDSGSTDLAYGWILTYLWPISYVLFITLFVIVIIVNYKIRQNRILRKIDKED